MGRSCVRSICAKSLNIGDGSGPYGVYIEARYTTRTWRTIGSYSHIKYQAFTREPQLHIALPANDAGWPMSTAVHFFLGDAGMAGLPGDVGSRGTPGEIGEDGPRGPEGERGDPADGPRNCRDLQDLGLSLTGWYYIYPDGNPMRVMCDMESDGGGWIVFQRRWDGSVDFNQNWDSFKRGFGNQWSEFWLGNENIHLLTSTGNFQLRIDLEDFDNNRVYATYSDFRLGGESEKYPLFLGGYTEGTAGDSLSSHKKQKFSTFDSDNDSSSRANCAAFYSAAWWHTACFDSSLNGEYLRGEHEKKGGIAWSTFKKIQYSLKFSEMKFRPDMSAEK